MAEPTVKTDTVLDALVAGKRKALEARRTAESLANLVDRARSSALPRPFAPALRGAHVRVIAEIKRASPAAGMLEASFDPVGRAASYIRGGAAAISVLTEEKRFLGRLSDLTAVRQSLQAHPGARFIAPARPPILRKDFIFDPYQIHEARAAGADAVLLIVAILEQDVLCQLLALATSLALGAIVEVHDEREAERAGLAGAGIVGINNRDLRTFVTSLDITEAVRPALPGDCIVVSESGIRDRTDVQRLARSNIDAVLVGEALMRSGDVVQSVRELASVPRVSRISATTEPHGFQAAGEASTGGRP